MRRRDLLVTMALAIATSVSALGESPRPRGQHQQLSRRTVLGEHAEIGAAGNQHRSQRKLLPGWQSEVSVPSIRPPLALCVIPERKLQDRD